ncbi:MAG: FkbM family methyltransferase [Chloroflexota bacterium]
MYRLILRKAQTFCRLWKEEGAFETLNILKSQILYFYLKTTQQEGLVRRFIPAISQSMWLSLEDSGLSKILFYRGVHEPLSTLWMKEELLEGTTVLDIGANLGYYVLLESARTGPKGRVFAIEPNPVAFEILKRNVEENKLLNVVTQPLAISAESGTVQMHLTQQFNWSHIPHEQLDSHRAIDMQRWVRKTIVVETRSLDDFVQQQNIPNLNFLRMDIEELEFEVVRGGRHTLTSHRPMKMLVEVHPFLATDLTPFVVMLNQLFDLGLTVKYIGHQNKTVFRWPTPEQAINYLHDQSFGQAPHFLFSSELPPERP